MLVDFYADWCGPCKEMPAILKQVKEDLKEGVRIVKVNVDKNPFIATQYKIKSIPTLIVFKNGTPHWTGVGVQNASEIKKVLRECMQQH